MPAVDRIRSTLNYLSRYLLIRGLFSTDEISALTELAEKDENARESVFGVDDGKGKRKKVQFMFVL